MDEQITNHKDAQFKGQQSNEELICFFRHHWIGLIREFLYFLIFIFVIFLLLAKMSDIQNVLKYNQGFKLLFLLGFIIGTVYVHRFFMKMINHFLDVRIITNARIIDHQKTIFFTDTMDAIDIAQIQNIERVSEGLLPNLLKYGDIKIYLSASSALRTLTYVPNDKFHFRCITRLKEALQQHLSQRSHTGLPQDSTKIPFETLAQNSSAQEKF